MDSENIGESHTDKEATDSCAVLDRERLTQAIEEIIEGLAEINKKPPPNEVAELILATYDLMYDPTKDTLVKFLRILFRIIE
ncbi:hypothetical protein [Gynuella sp.]|uniref:hypothetical protein n=1 Tax=Gynuella sp. TaxID=2969146 RepID=UPI003D0E7654